MLIWLVRQLPFLLFRLIITLCACWFMELVIRSEGYRVEFSTLLLAATCIIVATRLWAPRHHE